MAARVLLHGDFVPANLILTGPDAVTMIDPSLTETGLPHDDLARFINVMTTDKLFVGGLVVPALRRLRRDLDRRFRDAYAADEPGDRIVLELRLMRQYVLRWHRRREFELPAMHPVSRWARSRVIDLHRRSLLGECGERLKRLLSVAP
jgi:aminoglycoside phosphotransferase (APT) family kinase protein